MKYFGAQWALWSFILVWSFLVCARFLFFQILPSVVSHKYLNGMGGDRDKVQRTLGCFIFCFWKLGTGISWKWVAKSKWQSQFRSLHSCQQRVQEFHLRIKKCLVFGNILHSIVYCFFSLFVCVQRAELGPRDCLINTTMYIVQ